MDPIRFDSWTRRLSEDSSRRRVLTRLAAATVSVSGVHLTHSVGAKKRKKKLKRNHFGCVNVGKRCRGKDKNCCSGICKGKKPKQGERDRSRCVAHHAGNCTPRRATCATGSAAESNCNQANPAARCYATTGQAGFCDDITGADEGNCQPCRRDPDCEALGFGVGSACVVFDGDHCLAGCDTGCFPPDK